MARHHHVALVATVVAIAGLAVYRWHSSPAVQTKSVRRGPEPRLELRAQPEPEALEPSVLPRQVEPPPLPVAVIASAAPPSPPEEVDEAGPKLSDNLPDYRDYLQTVFTEDSRDRVWQGQSETRLKEGLARISSAGIRVDSVECRASLCKVVLRGSADADGGPSVMADAKRELMRPSFWAGPGLVVSDSAEPGADPRVTAFFGREDRPLPGS